MKNKNITEAELRILSVIWNNNNASVREVYNELSKEKDIVYTTVLKTMQNMHEKGLLLRDQAQRSHIYSAATQPEVVQKHLLGGLMDKAFGGSLSKLVISALGHKKVNEKELEEIKAMIKKLEENG